jgi:transposase
VLIDDEHRFDGVAVFGVDEHVWRHTRRGDKYVTVIIDLTGIRDGTGPARLLDMVEGRSKQAFKTWLAERPEAWRNGIEVVAMDGFTGFKTAATEELPDAVAVMDPFHVVRLAGDALDRCRRRTQQAIHGHRGRKDDPLYKSRRTLHTGADLLTAKQHNRLDALFAIDEHAEIEVTWWIYQRMIAAYRQPDRTKGRELMTKLIDSISHGVPTALSELVTLGRTLKKRAADVLAYFDRPGTSNGPTEAINGRLEHLRGSALGFRNPHQLHRPIPPRDRRLQTPTPTPTAVKSPQPAVSAARASLISSTEKRSGCQSWGSQSRISSAPSPIGVARGSYPPRTQSARSS